MKDYGCDSDEWKFEVHISTFSIPSQICPIFFATRLSNLSCCLICHCHIIKLHIFNEIFKKTTEFALIFFDSTSGFLFSAQKKNGLLIATAKQRQVLTMGTFFGSGPTPSPTSIPLGLPSLEEKRRKIFFFGWDGHMGVFPQIIPCLVGLDPW